MVSSKTLIIVAGLVALYSLSVTYYVSYYDANDVPSNSVSVYLFIYGPISPGGTSFWTPENFTAIVGQNVSLIVYNDDGVTHGLAIPKFNVDTGAIPSDTRKTVSFIAGQTGSFVFEEPPGDCGIGGEVCDSLQQLTGNFTVTPPSTPGAGD